MGIFKKKNEKVAIVTKGSLLNDPKSNKKENKDLLTMEKLGSNIAKIHNATIDSPFAHKLKKIVKETAVLGAALVFNTTEYDIEYSCIQMENTILGMKEEIEQGWAKEKGLPHNKWHFDEYVLILSDSAEFHTNKANDYITFSDQKIAVLVPKQEFLKAEKNYGKLFEDLEMDLYSNHRIMLPLHDYIPVDATKLVNVDAKNIKYDFQYERIKELVGAENVHFAKDFKDAIKILDTDCFKTTGKPLDIGSQAELLHSYNFLAREDVIDFCVEQDNKGKYSYPGLSPRGGSKWQWYEKFAEMADESVLSNPKMVKMYNDFYRDIAINREETMGINYSNGANRFEFIPNSYVKNLAELKTKFQRMAEYHKGEELTPYIKRQLENEK